MKILKKPKWQKSQLRPYAYGNTGTSWERTAFASTITQRASAAENLAMGEEARGLRDSFIEGFVDSAGADIGEHEGTGGKAHDRALQQVTSEFERAKGLYSTQEKRNSRTKSREGIDYFSTPEPLGQKMVEWAGIKSGMKVLEPSAGHGAIARWFPEDASRTVVEPSSELASRLMLAVGDAKVINSRFEDLHISNKYDAIVMNPLFGAGGKMAMAHIEKAFSPAFLCFFRARSF
ncbi:MAG: class I SAM-dependent methyltransferase [Desulfovibrionaceae bacterium]|nr:class I SAM-dependent methyltransferase [Desulfovibrionaceae bacterium]